jgi:hypothetical protein
LNGKHGAIVRGILASTVLLIACCGDQTEDSSSSDIATTDFAVTDMAVAAADLAVSDMAVSDITVADIALPIFDLGSVPDLAPGLPNLILVRADTIYHADVRNLLLRTGAIDNVD